MPTRNVVALGVVVCVALAVVGYFYPFSADVAQEKAASSYERTQENKKKVGKEQRLRERASALEEIGKAKKSQKKYRAAGEAERRAASSYERAQENKNDDKIAVYAKRIRNAQRLSSDIGEKLDVWFKDILNASEGPVKEDVSEKEANLQREEKIYILYEEAGKGSGRALFTLGNMYLHGIGVERNLGIAWAMYSLAEKRGTSTATNRLVPLADMMTSSEIATGKIVYERWDEIIDINQGRKGKGGHIM